MFFSEFYILKMALWQDMWHCFLLDISYYLAAFGKSTDFDGYLNIPVKRSAVDFS
jgi:hypothetical protein